MEEEEVQTVIEVLGIEDISPEEPVIPAAFYICEVMEAKVQLTKGSDKTPAGLQMIAVQLAPEGEVMDTDGNVFTGRIFDYLMVEGDNAQYGQRRYVQLLTAAQMAVSSTVDLKDLLGRRVQISLSLESAKGDYPRSNRVKKYLEIKE